MRRSAFVGVLTAGIFASAWFALQPLADPFRPGMVVNPTVAQPEAPTIQQVAATAPVVFAQVRPSESDVSQALQQALMGDECLSEGEALQKVMAITANADYLTAVAAVEHVSAQEAPCGAITVALDRSRGALQQTTTQEPAQEPPAFFGTGAPVGGGGGPGYVGG